MIKTSRPKLVVTPKECVHLVNAATRVAENTGIREPWVLVLSNMTRSGVIARFCGLAQAKPLTVSSAIKSIPDWSVGWRKSSSVLAALRSEIEGGPETVSYVKGIIEEVGSSFLDISPGGELHFTTMAIAHDKTVGFHWTTRFRGVVDAKLLSEGHILEYTKFRQKIVETEEIEVKNLLVKRVNVVSETESQLEMYGAYYQVVGELS